MRVEMNLTERLFASRLGMRTMLFRPPYSVDAEPDTEDEVKPLEVTQAWATSHRQQDRHQGLV